MSTTELAPGVRASTVYAFAHFDLSGAPAVPERFGAVAEFVPTSGWWSSSWHPSHGYSGPKVHLCDNEQHFAYYMPSDAPSWVPQPPTGWDLGVRTVAASEAVDE